MAKTLSELDHGGMQASGRHDGLLRALSVLGYVGAAIVGLELLVNLLLIRDHNSIGFGTWTMRNPLLMVILASVTAVLLVIGRIGGRSRSGAGVAALVGLAGTLISGFGLITGGAAGPIFALYWWALLVIGVAAALTSAPTEAGNAH